MSHINILNFFEIQVLWHLIQKEMQWKEINLEKGLFLLYECTDLMTKEITVSYKEKNNDS